MTGVPRWSSKPVFRLSRMRMYGKSCPYASSCTHLVSSSVLLLFVTASRTQWTPTNHGPERRRAAGGAGLSKPERSGRHVDESTSTYQAYVQGLEH